MNACLALLKAEPRCLRSLSSYVGCCGRNRGGTPSVSRCFITGRQSWADSMLRTLTEADWESLSTFSDGYRPHLGHKDRNYRRFLEALHFSGSKRVLASASGGIRPLEHCLEVVLASKPQRHLRGVLQVLADLSLTANLVQMFDSTTVCAHISAAGATGGSKAGRSALRAAASRSRSTTRPTSMVSRSLLT